jgi:hypothetical protein
MAELPSSVKRDPNQSLEEIKEEPNESEIDSSISE